MPANEHDRAPAIQGAEEILPRWIAAVEQLDPEAATALYAGEGMTFWGTFGSYCRTTPEQTREYFDRFLTLESLNCVVREIHWRALGPDAALATGSYHFTIRRPGEETVEAPARFTFAFQRTSENEWKIVEHHSSLFPENGF